LGLLSSRSRVHPKKQRAVTVSTRTWVVVKTKGSKEPVWTVVKKMGPKEKEKIVAGLLKAVTAQCMKVVMVKNSQKGQRIESSQ
jgi:hypothetical protein